MDPTENIAKLFKREFVESPLLETIEAGNLPLSTGKLVICDPLVTSDMPAFELKFPRGEFPVLLHREIESQCVAYSEIQFSNEPIQQWELATLPGQKVTELAEGEIYGFPVESGMAALMDDESQKDLVELEKLLFERKGEDFMGIYEEFFHREFFDESGAQNQYAFLSPLEKENSKLFAFEAGYGEGFYASYIATDEKGEAVKLVTEFIEMGA